VTLGRIAILDRRAAVLAHIFGGDHPVTLAAIARWRAAAGYQLRRGASDAEARAWNREAGEAGNGNRHERERARRRERVVDARQERMAA
jgi:hypothetical protein